jgi:AraC family transcriptional regulator, transcriptional activator of pobA
MIPIHQFENNKLKHIIVNELASQMVYDFDAPHRHQYFELFVFLNGGGVHVIDFESYPIEANSIHIVAPGQVHQVNRSADSYGFVFLFESFHFKSNKGILPFLLDHICLSNKELSPIYHFEGQKKERLRDLSQEALRVFKSVETDTDEIMLLILNWICYLAKSQRLQTGSSSTPQHKVDDSYSEFRKLVHANFRKSKTVKSYAQFLGKGEKTLTNLVLEKSGQTPAEIIRQQVLLEAKRQLLMGLSVKEVAYDLGFEDPTNFTKYFKKGVGITPTDFLTV